MKITLLVLITSYITLNIYVSKRINNAFYLKEDRRAIHKKLIWIMPFFGPLLIKSFWSKPKNTGLNVVTKQDRKTRQNQSLDSAGPAGTGSAA